MNLPDPTTRTTEGLHCLHFYYEVDQAALNGLRNGAVRRGREELTRILDPSRDGTPERLQSFVVPGHRADFGLMAMDHDPLVIDAIVQEIRCSPLGTVLKPAWSFVSLSEVSEYVPTVEQYGEKLRREERLSPEDDAYKAKVNAYEQRLPAMNQQRLAPNFPEWPLICFYPMNKIRDPHANWYALPLSERRRLMSEHAVSGIKFAGRVTQLITASTGYDDWEWGVTLWARNPESVKEIVYSMRFDEASARYAEFGPFYIGYVMPPAEALAHLRL